MKKVEAARLKEINWQAVLDKALDKDDHGHKNALGQLCQEYLRPKLFQFIQRKLQRENEIEDILQDVFETLVKYYENIEERDIKSFEAFVFRITANTCTDIIRRQHQYTKFILTQTSLEEITRVGVSKEIVTRLETLRDREIMGHQNFVRVLRTVLAQSYHRDTGATILKYTEKLRKASNDYMPQELPQETFINQEEIEDFVYTAIREELSSEEWELLDMRDLQGMTYREIAKKKGLELATVHARHKKILATLQQKEKLLARWNDIKENILS